MKIVDSREQKVSVLVANYNNSIYLNRCIKSIQNQNYKNILNKLLKIFFFNSFE